MSDGVRLFVKLLCFLPVTGANTVCSLFSPLGLHFRFFATTTTSRAVTVSTRGCTYRLPGSIRQFPLRGSNYARVPYVSRHQQCVRTVGVSLQSARFLSLRLPQGTADAPTGETAPRRAARRDSKSRRDSGDREAQERTNETVMQVAAVSSGTK